MDRKRSLRRCVIAAFGAALLPCAVFARDAEAGEAAAAEVLFQAGKQLMGQQKYAEACPKFEASYKLDHTLGTLLNLADCHEKLGKIATAWAEWGEAAEKATREGDNRADFAAKHRNALADKLPKLQVNVRNPRPHLDIFRDDIHLEAAMFDTPLPVDPGAHSIVIKRGDQVLKELKVDVAEGSTAAVQVDAEAIEKAAPPAPSAGPTGNAAGATTSRADAGKPPSHGSPQKTIGFIVSGVGVATVLGAAALEIVAVAKKPGEDQCVQKFCTADGKTAADGAKTFADVGQWVGIGGIVVLAVGVTMLLTAPSAPKQPGAAVARRRAFVAPWAAPTGGGLTVGGHL